MKYSFNLIDQPWIPCVLPDGSAKELSLRETLLNAHEIPTIFDQSPLVTAALHRLLLAILHRNFGPASQAEWTTLWQAGRFDKDTLSSYFTTWYHRFDLFDKKYPFYQVAQFSGKSKEVEVNDLLPDLARGNTPTLFDHTTDETSPVITFAQGARALLALQTYKLGGLSGLGTNYVDAPIARAAYLLVTGTNLFTTLLLNLTRYHGDDPIPKTGVDTPAWEREKSISSSLPQGYLDYLTWQTLGLRLVPHDHSEGNSGITKLHIALGRTLERGQIFDPGCAYRKNEKAKANQDPWPFVRFHESRALWRDSTTLLRLSTKDTRPPLALRWIAEATRDGLLASATQYRLVAYGLSADQANIVFWRRESMPLPGQYLSNESLVENLEVALRSAEDAARALQRAGTMLARCLLYPNRQGTDLSKAQADEAGRLAQHLAITDKYWPALEPPFFSTIRTLPNAPDESASTWLNTIRDTALTAFDQTTRDLNQSARTLQAVATSRAFLSQRLRYITEPHT